MLIYELRGFSLTILSFTETREEEKTLERKYTRRKQENKMQNL